MKIFASILLLIVSIVYLTGVSATTYRSYVDQDYGFYKASILDLNRSTSYQNISYEDKTLTIDIGDTIEWINYATPDWPITIISHQKLWEDRDAYLRWNYQKFNYTFTRQGVYTISIKECRRCQNQTIIVNPIETPAPTTTVTISMLPEPPETPIATPDATKSNTVSGFEIMTTIIIILSMAVLIRGT